MSQTGYALAEKQPDSRHLNRLRTGAVKAFATLRAKFALLASELAGKRAAIVMSLVQLAKLREHDS